MAIRAIDHALGLAVPRSCPTAGLIPVAAPLSPAQAAEKVSRAPCLQRRQPSLLQEPCPLAYALLRLAEAHSQAGDREDAARAVQRAHGFVI